MHHVLKQIRHDRENRPKEQMVPVSGILLDQFLPWAETIAQQLAAEKAKSAELSEALNASQARNLELSKQLEAVKAS